jgi:hypothetical protein
VDVSSAIAAWWQPGSHSLALSIFLRLMGFVYLLAFLSLLVQLKGLFGKKGILPIRDYLAAVKRLGLKRLYYVPTLFWLDSSDASIVLVCAAGVLFSMLLAFGVAPLASLIALWLLYLSFKSAGQDFLNFQWDTLLLETGFVSIIIAASGLSPVSLVLIWFLLFKFMVMAGSVKLTSGDPAWRELTAMNYHYQTQPLPNPLSWYAHLLPGWFQKATVAGMLVIEMLVPFLIFGTMDMRLAAFALFTLLQLSILLSGNYGPLNILTIVLGVPLLADLQLLPFSGLALDAAPVVPGIIISAVAVFLIVLDCVHILGLFFRNVPGRSITRALEPFELSNAYGLFAVMTKKRYEIIMEWSDDGSTWHEYGFRWKPGDPSKAPPECMPHMPRLDWLMWFLPFSPYEYNGWFLRFVEKLLQNSPDVMALMKDGPADPPRFVRAVEYDYSFTDWKTRKKTGLYWKRTPVALYAPILSTRDL